MENNYTKAYKEVLEVLKYVDKTDVNRIPDGMIKMFETKQDENYEFKYDESKKFEEQNFMQETRVIFAIIFKDYWANNYQREKIIAKQKNDIQKAEDEKREKYNPEEIFNKPKEIIEESKIIENSLIKYKESIFSKVINRIRNIFHVK